MTQILYFIALLSDYLLIKKFLFDNQINKIFLLFFEKIAFCKKKNAIFAFGNRNIGL